jgi:hypothetical protein
MGKTPHSFWKGEHPIDKPGVYLTKFGHQVGLWPTFNQYAGLAWTPITNHHVFAVPAFYAPNGRFWLIDYRETYDITDYISPLPIEVMRKFQDTFMLAMRETLAFTKENEQ